jgi:hypothetical protein
MASNWRFEKLVAGKAMVRIFSRGLVHSVAMSSILGCLAYAQAVPTAQAVVTPPPSTPSSTPAITLEPENVEAVDAASLLPDLPALPKTRASLIGGTIQKVDRVRDQMTVEVFGGGKMKIFFDTRTHIYAGNTLGTAPDLKAGDRVYLDTILDGSSVFARNIRVANIATGGNSQGVVRSYRADKNELELRDQLSPEPIKLRLSSGTQIVQDGHPASVSQLVPGTLVAVDFTSQKDVRDARKVLILAVPGTNFTFGGVVTSLDLHIGLLVLTSSSDRKTYEIYLDPAKVTVDDRLHTGADVTAVANFDGTRYVARSLTVNSK